MSAWALGLPDWTHPGAMPPGQGCQMGTCITTGNTATGLSQATRQPLAVLLGSLSVTTHSEAAEAKAMATGPGTWSGAGQRTIIHKPTPHTATVGQRAALSRLWPACWGLGYQRLTV